MMVSLLQKYNEASFNGIILELIDELTEQELLQLYAITKDEIIGEEIDRIKGKV